MNGAAGPPAGQPAEDVPPDAVTAAAAAPEAAEEPPPAAEAGDIREPTLAMWMGTFLADAGVSEEDLRGKLEEAGARPRVARVTVQRLTAVRQTLRVLASVAEEAQAEPEPETPAEAESPAEDLPDTAEGRAT